MQYFLIGVVVGVVCRFIANCIAWVIGQWGGLKVGIGILLTLGVCLLAYAVFWTGWEAPTDWTNRQILMRSLLGLLCGGALANYVFLVGDATKRGIDISLSVVIILSTSSLSYFLPVLDKRIWHVTKIGKDGIEFGDYRRSALRDARPIEELARIQVQQIAALSTNYVNAGYEKVARTSNELFDLLTLNVSARRWEIFGLNSIDDVRRRQRANTLFAEIFDAYLKPIGLCTEHAINNGASRAYLDKEFAGFAHVFVQVLEEARNVRTRRDLDLRTIARLSDSFQLEVWRVLRGIQGATASCQSAVDALSNRLAIPICKIYSEGRICLGDEPLAYFVLDDLRSLFSPGVVIDRELRSAAVRFGDASRLWGRLAASLFFDPSDRVRNYERTLAAAASRVEGIQRFSGLVKELQADPSIGGRKGVSDFLGRRARDLDIALQQALHDLAYYTLMASPSEDAIDKSMQFALSLEHRLASSARDENTEAWSDDDRDIDYVLVLDTIVVASLLKSVVSEDDDELSSILVACALKGTLDIEERVKKIAFLRGTEPILEVLEVNARVEELQSVTSRHKQFALNLHATSYNQHKCDSDWIQVIRKAAS